MTKRRRFFNRFLLLLLMVCITTWGAGLLEAEQLELGKIYYGFKLSKEKEMKELDMVGLVFEHTKSGAQLLKLKTNDDDNMICIAFATPTDTDCGTPHIMEHSVLNGSRKFPTKSPFDVLKKGSLNTYLNAFTFADNTIYPASSRNDKDFFNLMDVYLDAVFFPCIYDEPKILQREGWYYGLESKESEIRINGIVYNEEQGSFSNPQRQLTYYINKYLFPDNTYGYSSGGNPDFIPDLTYEQFLDFHKKYYHPSNSLIILYGDGNILEELKFIDENYLSKFDKAVINADIPLQKPFDKMKEITREYAISSDGDEKDNTWLSLNFVVGQSNQRETSLALEILTDVLLNLPSSPLHRALIDAGIGKESYGIFRELKQNSFSIIVKSANENDKEKFKVIMFDALKKLAKQGLDKKMLAGIINQLEFRIRENNYPWSGYPKALGCSFQAVNGWQYANDPFVSLEYEQTFNTLKKGLQTDYYETLLEKYLLNNNHSLLLVMKPNRGLAEEKKKRLKEKLAQYKASLSDAKLDKLVQQTAALKKYQDSPDSPEDLKKIPLLSIKDVDPKAENLEVTEEEIAGVKALTYSTFTNSVVYSRLLFDASVVPQELAPYASLLADVMGILNTKNYSYGDLDTKVNLHTGGIFFNINTYFENFDHKKFKPEFEVDARALPEKLGKLMELQGEILKNTLFYDSKRLKEVITQLNARLEVSLQNRGTMLANIRLSSYFSPWGKYMELTDGLSYDRFVSNIVKNFDAQAGEIAANLKKTADLLFNKKNLTVAVTCPAKDYSVFKEKFPELLKFLGDKIPAPASYVFEFKEKNEGLQSTSNVQSVVKGYDFKALGYTYSGKFAVLSQILTRDYLHQKIRILGGAYGRFAEFSRVGLAGFGSYRDPQLGKTLEAYDSSPDYLANFSADDREMTRYILGTISLKDVPLKPQQKGTRAVNNYLQGLTYADIQKERDEILNTTQEDIRKMAKMVSDIMKQNVFCVFGNEKTLEENKQLFNKLVKVSSNH